MATGTSAALAHRTHHGSKERASGFPDSLRPEPRGATGPSSKHAQPGGEAGSSLTGGLAAGLCETEPVRTDRNQSPAAWRQVVDERRPAAPQIAERNRLRSQCQAVPARLRGPSPSLARAVDRTLKVQREVRQEIRRRKRRQREQLYGRSSANGPAPRCSTTRQAPTGESAPPASSTAVAPGGPAGERRWPIGCAWPATTTRSWVVRAAKPTTHRQADEPTSNAGLTANSRSQWTARSNACCGAVLARRMSRTSPFTAGEVLHAMTQLRNGKATGADGIPSECLRYGGEAARDALLLLCNELWSREQWPAQWSLGLICPIFKGKGEQTELDNHRPITLLSVMSKLFETLINTRLKQWVEEHQVLCDEQGGFRTSRGCPDQLFILQEVLSSRAERKRPTYVAFLDVRSAYDRVWRNGLWVRLHQSGVRGKVWRMLRAMYQRVRRAVLVDGQRTGEFDVEVGVSQGSVLSPLLYSVFIDGLIRSLKADRRFGAEVAGEQLTCLLYADDIALIADSAETLQLMLDSVSEYARSGASASTRRRATWWCRELRRRLAQRGRVAGS